MKKGYVIAAVIGLCAVIAAFYLISTRQKAAHSDPGAELAAPAGAERQEGEESIQDMTVETEEIQDTEEGSPETEEDELTETTGKDAEKREDPEQTAEEMREPADSGDGNDHAEGGRQDTETEEMEDPE